MIYKHICHKNKKIITILIVLIVLTILLGFYCMEQKKYQMYVFRYVDDNDPNFPHKKFWFNAEQWLSDEENYLKISDSYILYKKGIKMPNTNIILQRLYVHFLIQKDITEEQLPYDDFLIEVGKSVHGHYLYSKFDRDSLKPTIHSFLINFHFKNIAYEAQLIWEMEKQDIIILGIYMHGSYNKMHNNYNYSDYLKGKPVPNGND